nr:SUMF1/EgtB/PvdO family nonheme iron enzyme [Segatella copri]
MVLIDSKLVKGSNGIVKTVLPIGQHSYMVVSDGYESEEGTVKLKSTAPSNLQIALSKATLPIMEDEIVATNKKQQTNELEVTTLRESVTSMANVSRTENIVKPSLKGNLVTIPVKEGIYIEMVKVEKGSMTMTYRSGLTKLLVGKLKASIAQDYYVGKYEVTQALWQAVMGNNPSKNKGDNLPVEKVTWNECQDFIKELNKLTGKNFRLPTALEWFYAARGGNRSHGYKYSGSNKLSEVAWYDSNSKNKTHPVGTKLPNELGLYDMSGNVWEWCQDLGKSTKKSSKSLHGASRILCGGSWSDNAKYCTSLYLDEKPEGFYSIYTGMRLAFSE